MARKDDLRNDTEQQALTLTPLARCSYSRSSLGQKQKLSASTTRRYCTVCGPPSKKCVSAQGQEPIPLRDTRHCGLRALPLQTDGRPAPKPVQVSMHKAVCSIELHTQAQALHSAGWISKVLRTFSHGVLQVAPVSTIQNSLADSCLRSCPHQHHMLKGTSDVPGHCHAHVRPAH